MNRSFTLLTLAALSLSVSLHGIALAGNHPHSSGQNKSNSGGNTCEHSILQQLLTGTRNGVGFIADPKPHSHQNQPPDPKVTKITDPIPTGKFTPKSSITETSLIALPTSTPAGGGGGPVVRDHSVPKPGVTTPTGSRYDAITTGSGSLGLGDGTFILQGLNPFADHGFTAPEQIAPGVRDHRTSRGHGGGHGTGSDQPFQVDTNGPANKTP